MSQKPPRQRPTQDPNQDPNIRRTPAQRNPASTNRARQPEDVLEQTPTRQSASRQAPQRQGQVRQQQGRPREGGPRQGQYRQAAPRRDPFPLLIGGILGAVLVGVAALVILLTGNNNPGTPPVPNNSVAGGPTAPVAAGAPTIQVQSANLPGVAVPDEGKNHITDGTPITYTNYPPSSGTHYGTTAEYGFSDKEIPEGKLVHTLEHGGIVIYYKPDLPAAVKDSLRQAYTTLPPGKYGKVKLVITPYSNPKMKTPLTIAAWTRIQTLPEFNYQQIQAFYQALVDKGPEDVP